MGREQQLHIGKRATKKGKKTRGVTTTEPTYSNGINASLSDLRESNEKDDNDLLDEYVDKDLIILLRSR